MVPKKAGPDQWVPVMWEAIRGEDLIGFTKIFETFCGDSDLVDLTLPLREMGASLNLSLGLQGLMG
jgi:hypothetical protein